MEYKIQEFINSFNFLTNFILKTNISRRKPNFRWQQISPATAFGGNNNNNVVFIKRLTKPQSALQ